MIESLGVFGGTFDPPHLGHLILAAEALNQLQLTRVLGVLSPQPYHKLKRPVTAQHHRLEMLKHAIRSVPEFELSTIELEREGPHFSFDTINLLQERHPTARLVQLIGSDQLLRLPNWKHSDDLIKAVFAIGVMHRPGNEIDLATLENKLPGLISKLRFFETPQMEISSSFIRQRIASAGHYRFFLPAGVYDYIQQNKLYSEDHEKAL
jgi:nicotinate-nucleotide adenylyltransferase